MAKKLYHHKTDGGAEYLCLKEDDLSTAVVRLDGHPEMIRGDENAAFSELLDTLRAAKVVVAISHNSLEQEGEDAIVSILARLADAYKFIEKAIGMAEG